MTSYSRNLDCFSKKNMTNFQVYTFLEKTQNLRVESKTVTTRH